MGTLRGSDYGAVFRSSPAAMLILDPELRIVDANPAYLASTNRELSELVGRTIFDAFPANPHFPQGDGVENLRTSLDHVLRKRQSHHMWVQRYDVPWDGAPGGFVERYWSPTNCPIIDTAGDLVGVLHVAEDVTGLHDDLVAALDFYRAEIAQGGNDDADAARRFTEYAKTAMSNARVYADVVTEVEQLREALTSRATIDQAKGIVMAETGCGPEEAFQVLVARSKATNTKVRDLAADLVAHTSRRRPSDGG